MPRLIRRFIALLVLTGVLLNGTAVVPGKQAARAGGIGPLTTTLAYPEPPLLAQAAAVLDVDSGQWLRLYHADLPLPMASTTKIMTALLALQHGNLQDTVRISRRAAKIGQSTMGLVAGEQVTMHDLLYGLLLPSGNDAAIAIAEHLSGSVEAFVARMNVEARILHLTHTRYTTPYGFSQTPDGDDPAHVTSVRDLVLLARLAMQYPLFRQIVATPHYVVPRTALHQRHDLRTVNYFIQWYPGADGVKPGWTSGAGVCQVIDVRRHGRHLLVAILHTTNIYTDARDLMNAALGDFTWIPSGHAGDSPDQVVRSGTTAEPVWYFPLTGHSLRGAFLRYYRQRGGYAALGAPQTEIVAVDGATRQYFSDQVLTLNARSGRVAPEQLGYGALPAPNWLTSVQRSKDTSTSRYYAQTGHAVTNRFLGYYLAYGGPSVFGYPISEKRELDGTLVQFFENAELIWHAQPDFYHGYVSAGSLGIRCLVGLGLIVGPGLPAALHRPYLPGSRTGPGPAVLPSPTSAVAGLRATATAGAWIRAVASATTQALAQATTAAAAKASARATEAAATEAAATAAARQSATAAATRTATPSAVVATATDTPSATPSVTAAAPTPGITPAAGATDGQGGTATASPAPSAVSPGASDTPISPVG